MRFFDNNDNENVLVDFASVNRMQVLKNLGEYVNGIYKIWKESIEKKPISWEWRFVSWFNLSKPDKSKCEECVETLKKTLEQLSQTAVENPAQFKTYLNTFIELVISTTIFQGTPAEATFANLINYVNHSLENDLKLAQADSIEIPELKTSNSCP